MRHGERTRLAATIFALGIAFSCWNVAWSQQPAAEKSPGSQPKKAAAVSTPPAAAPTPSSKPASPAAPKSGPAGAGKAADDLSVEQARLADRYKRLEEVIGRLAELSASTDPRRAQLLREAIAQSREQDVNTRFETIVKLLQEERLSVAATNQTELQKELESLLGLLLKADRDKELTSQRERIHKYLKEVDRLIRVQKGVRARTAEGDPLKPITEEQKRLATETGKLGSDIATTDGDKKKPSGDSLKPADKQPLKSDDGKSPDKPGDKPINSKNDSQSGGPSKPQKPADGSKPGGLKKADEKNQNGKPSNGDQKPSSGKPKSGQPSNGQPSKPSDSPPNDSQPEMQTPDDSGNSQQRKQQPQEPADRAANRLRAAQQRMDDALKKLEESKRQNAADVQLQAVKELEQAKAELERVLRQLREEELERTLTQLSARFRKMLEMQTAVYEGTVHLDHVPEAQRTHDHEIESARLSRQESQIVLEVNKALLVLHDEGSSVAFPEAIEQMRDDMRQVAERLAALKVEKITQGLEKDIIAALEETITALDMSLKDLEKKRTPRGQQPAAGQPDDMPLVDKLAELKMIRSLQMRINNRTKTYGEMIHGEQAESPDLLKALDGLAERQQRVWKATSDLQQGRNQSGHN